MASYVVMEPPVKTTGGKTGKGAGERAVLVRDGFRFLAFLLPALWLVFNRLWIETVVVIAMTMALSALGAVAGFGNATPALVLLVSLYVGLEASALKLAALRRRGWREWGVVEADNAEALTGSDETPAPPPTAGPAAPRSTSQPALGLLAYPGKS
jgi:hypothetical protein